MSHLLDSTRVYFPGHDGDPDHEADCMWFALCDRPANGVGDAGPLGHLPICRRCAERVGMTEFVDGGVD
jgi:hypothetical protein